MKLISEKPILIVPLGTFAHPAQKQVIDIKAVERIMAQFKAWGRDIVVDYQHESMKECGRAPAAGWVKTANASSTINGIEAPIEWTDEARRLIEAKEYRFISPVFESVNGKIIRLVNLGLTNNPNIHSMKPLVNQLETQERDMDLLTKLKKLMNLDKKSKEQEAIQAVETLIAKKETEATLAALLGEKVALLGLTPEASDDDIVKRIEKMATESASSSEVAIERMVNDAISAGKLAPSQKGWASALARTDADSFRLFLINSGPALPLGGIITPCARTERPLSESEGKVCRLLNVNEKDYLKYGN
ncbi:Mu-like prophage FluMu I protein [hydrothermal vent metagenome]|uniref:Mu-like prophage FluMu I protein n=1 Tax=hydrothermal vent metagenome TaxID=652676 RepID=A0A3B1BZ79_9ZZZZ